MEIDDLIYHTTLGKCLKMIHFFLNLIMGIYASIMIDGNLQSGNQHRVP